MLNFRRVFHMLVAGSSDRPYGVRSHASRTMGDQPEFHPVSRARHRQGLNGGDQGTEQMQGLIKRYAASAAVAAGASCTVAALAPQSSQAAIVLGGGENFAVL